MSLLVVGSMAFDSVKTPFGEREDAIGGSATYFEEAHASVVVGVEAELLDGMPACLEALDGEVAIPQILEIVQAGKVIPCHRNPGSLRLRSFHFHILLGMPLLIWHGVRPARIAARMDIQNIGLRRECEKAAGYFTAP